MPISSSELERVRPAGGKRSSKRDLIVNVFRRREGRLSADDLVDLIRKEDHRISRAIVCRTLQWMVEDCRNGRPAAPKGGATTEAVFSRDALRIAIATERSGLDFCSRAARITLDPRGRTASQTLAAAEKEHLGTLETRYAQLLSADPQLESCPTFLFVNSGTNGLFAEGSDRLTKGVNDQQALMIGIRCERGSHRFFKKYGERFEGSEGRQIFMEFADEERAHVDLLIRQYRNLVKRKARKPRKAARARRH